MQIENSYQCVHTDADGIGGIILNRYFNINYTKYSHKNYPDFEDKDFIAELKTFKNIVFTDIAPDQDLLIDLLNDSNIESIEIYDHHDARNYLVEFKHEKLHTYFDITKSGTKIYYENFIKKHFNRIPNLIEKFVELVDVYDLWKLDNPLREESENLNRLFLQTCNYADQSNHKHDWFIKTTLDKINNNIDGFTHDDYFYIEQKIQKEKDLLAKARTFLKIKLDERKVKYGITKASSCISYVASELLKENDIDYVLVLNTYSKSNNALSIRSKENFDINTLNFVAGHKNAGGYNFPNKQLFNSFYDFGKQLGYKEITE